MTNINPLTQLSPLLDSSGSSSSMSGASSSSSSISNSNPLAALADNSQAFLQLLVAQLEYQDPMNPVSGTAFLSQTAQMTEASEVTQLVQTVQQEESAIQTSTAASMIGMQVSATDSSGNPVSGVVTSVSIDPTNGPSVTVGGESIPLSSVTEVSPATT